MNRRAPAQVSRAKRRAALARRLQRALCDHDVDQLEVSAATGASSSVVQRWVDRAEPHTPSIADVPAIGDVSRDLARDLLGWAAEPLDLVVCRRRAAAGDGTLHEALIDSVRASAAVQAGIAEALSPQSPGGARLTQAERRELAGDVTQLERVVASLRTLVTLDAGDAEEATWQST